jgi:hypothetical protein
MENPKKDTSFLRKGNPVQRRGVYSGFQKQFNGAKPPQIFPPLIPICQRNQKSYPTTTSDILKPLKMLDFPFSTVYRKRPKSTDSRNFQVHFSVHQSGWFGFRFFAGGTG